MNPAEFRQELLRVHPSARDQWVNEALGFGEIPPDGPDLPRGCVPYLPCPVDAVLSFVDRARVGPEDVLVDVGSGLGRAMTLVHLLTGAAAVGIEVQAALAHAATRIARALSLQRVHTIHGSAEELIADVTGGSVYFFYCPFGKARLERVLGVLEPMARARALRFGFVDMPAPELPWLHGELASANEAVAIYRTVPSESVADSITR